MSMDSLAVTPVVPDADIFSLPAKSTNQSLEVTTLSKLEGSTVSIVIEKIACDLDDA